MKEGPRTIVCPVCQVPRRRSEFMSGDMVHGAVGELLRRKHPSL